MVIAIKLGSIKPWFRGYGWLLARKAPGSWKYGKCLLMKYGFALYKHVLPTVNKILSEAFS